MSEERELTARRALARTGPGSQGSPGDPVSDAEARLRAAVDEVSTLDVEVEELSAGLADFARRYEHELGAEHAELSEAERVVRRLRQLEEALSGLARWMQDADPRPRAGPGVRRREARPARRSRSQKAAASRAAPAPPPGGASAAPIGAQTEPEVEPLAVRLKRVYRRLARLLHPDLAQDEGERVRLGALMATVNAAYGRQDLTALEVMAEKLGAGEPPGDVSPEERRAHLERRTAAMARFAASLARERDRLRQSDTFRLAEESRRRAAEGGDLFAEARRELAEEIAAAWADALLRLKRLEKTAREVSRARTAAMTEMTRRGPTGAKRAFDPLRENEIVRAGASRLDRRRATGPARDLARRLEDAAPVAPWEVALTLFAFFAEEAGGRPPEALASAEGWAARWDLVRAGWDAAPELSRALGRLPHGLTLGARLQGEGVLAGVQLAEADLLAGVRIALEGEGVAAIGRRVLAALGPEETCSGCRARGPALHLLRTRGLDERHGLACPQCGTVLRSYWRYGEVDGLEALAPHARRLGLTAEVTAELAGTSIGFGMTPAQQEALTAGDLRRRFAELYLAPYRVDLAAAQIAVSGADGPLRAAARLAGHDDLRLEPAAGPHTAEELLELLRARIERRFRP
jgi:hypothetical protein